MLRVVVVDIGHQICVPLKDEMLVGRQDPDGETSPALDLTPYGAVEKGVSRRHAKILRHEGELTIEDVGSVNGTFLNGYRITPYQPVLLGSGDVVQMGALVLQIYFDLPDSEEESGAES